jgi:hypothetical protein
MCMVSGTITRKSTTQMVRHVLVLVPVPPTARTWITRLDPPVLQILFAFPAKVFLRPSVNDLSAAVHAGNVLGIDPAHCRKI